MPLEPAARQPRPSPSPPESGDSSTPRTTCAYAPKRSLPFQPRLEHEDVPQQVMPAAVALLVLVPLLANGAGVEEPLALQPLFTEERVGPVAQWPSQPLVDGDAEPHLRPLYDGARNVPVQNALQQQLSPAVLIIESGWNPP